MTDEKSLETLIAEAITKLQDSEFLEKLKMNFPENNIDVHKESDPVTSIKEQQRKINESLASLRKHRKQSAKLNKDLRKLNEIYKRFKK